MGKIETNTHHVFRDKNDIIHIDVIEGAHIDLTSLNRLHEICNSLSPGKKKLVLVDARHHHTMTDEAMDYLKKEMMDKSRIATAIISNKLAIRIVVDYITNVLKSDSPVKMFPAEPEALEWLLTFKSSNKS